MDTRGHHTPTAKQHPIRPHPHNPCPCHPPANQYTSHRTHSPFLLSPSAPPPAAARSSSLGFFFLLLLLTAPLSLDLPMVGGWVEEKACVVCVVEVVVFWRGVRVSRAAALKCGVGIMGSSMDRQYPTTTSYPKYTILSDGWAPTRVAAAATTPQAARRSRSKPASGQGCESGRRGRSKRQSKTKCKAPSQRRRREAMYWMGRYGWGGFGFFLSDGWGVRGSTTTSSRLATTPQSFNRGNDENDALSPRLNRQPGMHGCKWK